MKKLEQYVIYIGLTVSILFNVVCGLSIKSLNNDIVQLEDYVDKTAKHIMKQIEYTNKDVEFLEFYVGYKSEEAVDTSWVDIVIKDTAEYNEFIRNNGN